jgi:hypothetical protein
MVQFRVDKNMSTSLCQQPAPPQQPVRDDSDSDSKTKKSRGPVRSDPKIAAVVTVVFVALSLYLATKKPVMGLPVLSLAVRCGPCSRAPYDSPFFASSLL